MKKILSLITAVIMAFALTLTAFAANGKVTYNGNAKQFIFEPGSKYSPTDLFPNFKDVMPGDSLIQKITVKNDASNKVKVKIYMRSLGAHADSVDFLSRLGLTVQKSEDNKMAYMFDAAASDTAQLTDWVCLGTLYSGGEVNLDVVLTVPTELGNDYQEQIGYLDWEFMIEELPIEESDPTPPKTGDDFNLWPWVGVLAVSLTVVIILLPRKRKEKEEESAPQN